MKVYKNLDELKCLFLGYEELKKELIKNLGKSILTNRFFIEQLNSSRTVFLNPIWMLTLGIIFPYIIQPHIYQVGLGIRNLTIARILHFAMCIIHALSIFQLLVYQTLWIIIYPILLGFLNYISARVWNNCELLYQAYEYMKEHKIDQTDDDES